MRAPDKTRSEGIKPVAGTKGCQLHHVGTLVSGRMHVAHDDGTESEIRAGEAHVIEPGYDALVVGYEFDSSSDANLAAKS